METVNKPFAPFSILFHQIAMQKIRLTYSPYFFVGAYAYQEAKKSVERGQLAFCLPAGHSVTDYDWPVAGLRLLLFDTGGMSALGLSKLSFHLLKLGAELVCTYSEGNKPDTVDIHALKKEFNHARQRNQAAIARKYGRTR